MDLDKKLKIMENRNTLLEKENKKLKSAAMKIHKIRMVKIENM